MGLDDRAGDRQTEPGAGRAALATGLGSPEALEQSLARRRGDARSMIANRDPRDLALALDAHLDRGPRRRVHERVAQEVGEHLLQLQRIGKHLDGLLGVQRDRTLRRGRARVGYCVACELDELDGPALAIGSFLEPRQRQQVLDEHAHSLGLLLDPAHRHRRLLRLGRGAHPKQLGIAADRGQRCAQLVRGIGEKAAQPLFALGSRGEGLLQALEHRVQRKAEPSDLGRRRSRADAPVKLPCRDLAGGHGDPVERAQADFDDEERGGAERQQHTDDHEPLDEQQPVERLIDLAQRHRDDGQSGVLRVVDHIRAVAQSRGAGRGDGEQLVDRHARGDLRRGRRGLPEADQHVTEHSARGRTTLTVGTRRQVQIRRTAVVRPACQMLVLQRAGFGVRFAAGRDLRRAVARQVSSVVERLRDGRAGGAHLLVEPAEQEGLLLGIRHGAERDHSYGGQHEHARQHARAQRGHQPRGACNA